MKNLTAEQTNGILKLQATLTRIAAKQPVFFNVAQFVSMGLVREFGRTNDNRTNWVLTEKGKAILNVQL